MMATLMVARALVLDALAGFIIGHVLGPDYGVRYPAAEDLDLFLRLMDRYDCANLPAFGLYYELTMKAASARRSGGGRSPPRRVCRRYLNVLNWRGWAGIAKSLLRCAPFHGALQWMKRALFARWGVSLDVGRQSICDLRHSFATVRLSQRDWPSPRPCGGSRPPTALIHAAAQTSGRRFDY